MSVFCSCVIVVFADNNSEDEGASVAKAVKTGLAEGASKPEEKMGGMEADGDEADGEELDGEDSQQAEDGDPNSKVEGRQMASMSTRSESKPYSSVTHKCEVRNISMSAERSKRILWDLKVLCCNYYQVFTNYPGIFKEIHCWLCSF